MRNWLIGRDVSITGSWPGNVFIFAAGKFTRSIHTVHIWTPCYLSSGACVITKHSGFTWSAYLLATGSIISWYWQPRSESRRRFGRRAGPIESVCGRWMTTSNGALVKAHTRYINVAVGVLYMCICVRAYVCVRTYANTGDACIYTCAPSLGRWLRGIPRRPTTSISL